jgi:hypothetical protein
VISDQRDLGLFDDRHVFVAFVIDDVDCDLADLLRLGTGSGQRTAEIAKRQPRLSRKIAIANQLAVDVFGLLARGEYQTASPRDNHLGIHFRSRQILGIDAFERHCLGLLPWSNSDIPAQARSGFFRARTCRATNSFTSPH